MSKKRITILDISKKLNVSTTTVNKALSGKQKISDMTRELVLKTAKEMGYKPNRSAQALARRQLRIGIVLSKIPDEYNRYLIHGCEQGIRDLYDFNVKGEICTVDTNSSTEQSIQIIKELRTQKVDGLIIQPILGYRDYIDLIDEIIESGLPVVSLVTTLYENKNTGCVRVNSRVVGQLAGQFLSSVLARGSKVAVFTSNREMRIHKDYVEGFTDFTDREKVDIVGVYETQDIEYTAYTLTENLLKEHPDIGGIYVTSYVSVPVCRCLEKHNRHKDVVVVGQDLYPALVDCLRKGSLNATIFQDQYQQGRKSVEMMYERLTNPMEPPYEYLVVPQLVMNGNLECYVDRY